MQNSTKKKKKNLASNVLTRLTPEMTRMVKKIARENCFSVSMVIRQAVEKYVKSYRENKAKKKAASKDND